MKNLAIICVLFLALFSSCNLPVIIEGIHDAEEVFEFVEKEIDKESISHLPQTSS